MTPMGTPTCRPGTGAGGGAGTSVPKPSIGAAAASAGTPESTGPVAATLLDPGWLN